MTARRLRLVSGFVLCLTAAGCAPTFRNHGYVPPAEDLATIEIGATRDSVAEILGPPGVSGIVDQSGWYYVRSRWRNYAWRPPQEIDRRVLAISFSDAGRVSNVEEFGLERGRVVRLSRRVTTANTQGIGFLRQAFGNLGQVNLNDFLN